MAVEKTEGISREEARKKVFLKDSKGLIVKNRSTGGISHHKEPFAQDHPEMTDLVYFILLHQGQDSNILVFKVHGM